MLKLVTVEVTSDDHSAITTSNPNVFISKMGPGVLASHIWNGIPDYDHSNLKYYIKKPTITGSNYICAGTNYTFSASIWKPGYTWDKSSNLTITGSGSSVTVTKNGSDAAGWVSIKLNDVELAKKTVWVGLPGINNDNANDKIIMGVLFSSPPNNEVCRNRSVYIGVTSSHGPPRVTDYEWYFGSWASYVTEYSENTHGIPKGYAKIYLDNNANSSQVVSVTARNGCSPPSLDNPDLFSAPGQKQVNTLSRSNDAGNTFYAISCSGGYSIVYPNPVSDVLSININASEIESPTGLSFDIRLYDALGNILRQQKPKDGTIEFNVANLPNGVYYLHIYDGVNEKPEMRQIVVEQ